uniref:acyl-ACP--UDP-N-acetylglucosamine O-acyltransferase n=1 Tax=Phocaeicola coprocola TaxID=310298 RepID=UPI00402813F0
MISPLAYVDPSAKIGKNVTVHPFAYIDKNVEIGDDNVIMPYVSLMSGTRMGNGNTVYQGAVVAAVPQDFTYTGEDTLACIGNNNVIRENAVIIRGTHAGHATSIGDGNFIMTGARLSHDVEVGNHCIIGNGSQVSGNCIIQDCAILTSNVLMQGNTRLGSYSLVQGGCRFIKDIPPYIVAAHEPIAFYSINTKVLELAGFSETLIKHIAQAYRILYKANTSQHDALLRIEEQVPNSPEIDRIVEFVRTSKLGIIH